MAKTQISETCKHNFNCIGKIPCAIFWRKNWQTMFNFMHIFEISHLEFIKKNSDSKKLTLLHIYYNVHYNVYWDEPSSGTWLLLRNISN